MLVHNRQQIDGRGSHPQDDSGCDMEQSLPRTLRGGRPQRKDSERVHEHHGGWNIGKPCCGDNQAKRCDDACAIFTELKNLGQLLDEQEKSSAAAKKLQKQLSDIRQRLSNSAPVKTLLLRDESATATVGRSRNRGLAGEHAEYARYHAFHRAGIALVRGQRVRPDAAGGYRRR